MDGFPDCIVSDYASGKCFNLIRYNKLCKYRINPEDSFQSLKGYLISCMTSSISMALSVGPPIIIPFLLFGGYFLNSGSVPVYFKWLSYLSWFRYGNEGLLINQWASVGQGEIECTRQNATCPSSGHVILETLSFSEVR